MTSVLTHALIAGAVALAACGPAPRSEGTDAQNGFRDAPCNTTISGKVFAPNGTLPLYNVNVYIPGSDPPPFTPGANCDKCQGQLPGGAIAKATSDAEGKFQLAGVPYGVNIPVIITTGKWRRKITMPNVGACVDNPIPDGMFRLPKNRTEGELPRIAMVTGGCDGLACVLTKLGIDSAEFGDSSAGPKSVVFYNGSGGAAPGAPQAAPALWNNLDELKKFDLVLNSCECSENNANKTAPDVLRQYADLGGRVFGSHFHYTWTKTLIPQWQGTASWTSGSSGTPDLVDTSHPDGLALAKWLVAVGASTVMGQVMLNEKTPNASQVQAPTLRWLYASGAANPTSHYLSFKTPVGTPAMDQCGKVVYAGMHVAGTSEVDTTFPMGCSATFTPDEKALVFLLFDLSSCVDIIL